MRNEEKDWGRRDHYELLKLDQYQVLLEVDCLSLLIDLAALSFTAKTETPRWENCSLEQDSKHS